MRSFTSDRRPIGQRGAIRLIKEDSIPAEPTHVAPHETQNEANLETLIERIRADIGWLSISSVVHAYNSADVASAFVGTISSLLHAPDSVTVTPPTPGVLDNLWSDARPVSLNYDQSPDWDVYMGITGDLVFFSAMSEQEVEMVETWARRARAVVIYAKGPFAEQITRAACRGQLLTYHWTEGEQVTKMKLIPA